MLSVTNEHVGMTVSTLQAGLTSDAWPMLDFPEREELKQRGVVLKNIGWRVKKAKDLARVGVWPPKDWENDAGGECV